MYAAFGVGKVYGVPVGGNTPTDKTPMELIGLQEVSFNRTAKFVPLKGASQYPDAVAVADKEIKGKAKVGRIDGDMFNQFMFGENPTTNAPIIVPDEAATIPASAPYTYQVVGHTTFVAVSTAYPLGGDLGVRYTNGQPFINMQGATLTAKGQYNVNAATATYTFYSGDAAATITVSYQETSTAGTFFTEHNQLMGWSPILQMVLWNPFASTLNLNNNNGFIFYNVVFGGLNVPIKRDDWEYPELEWEAYPSPTNTGTTGLPAVWSIIDGSGLGL